MSSGRAMVCEKNAFAHATGRNCAYIIYKGVRMAHGQIPFAHRGGGSDGGRPPSAGGCRLAAPASAHVIHACMRARPLYGGWGPARPLYGGRGEGGGGQPGSGVGSGGEEGGGGVATWCRGKCVYGWVGGWVGGHPLEK